MVSMYKDRDKQVAYQRTWLRTRKARFFEGKVCVDCGSSVGLCIHHRNPEEKVSHRIWSWKLSRILAELEKCDIVCRSCHAKRHGAHRHGSRAMYSRGCRCAACRSAKATS